MLQLFDKKKLVAGCDESGRGSLAGPVFAAAVILPSNFYHPKLNDSKKLKEKDRSALKDFIEQNAVSYSVSQVSEKEIDRINILNASIQAMHLALDNLDVRPEVLLVDGNRFHPYSSIPHQCIVKGDGKYASIAAASILAKTYRDDYMKRLSDQFPTYGWCENKGYATRAHRAALLKNGPCIHHRKSFHVKNQRLLFDIEP